MRPLIAVLANVSPAEDGQAAAREVVNRAYLTAIAQAGGIPFGVPCLDVEVAVAQLLSRADGLLVTGGADVAPSHFGQDPHGKLGTVSPERDALDRVALAYALAHPELPVLAICRGIQSLAVFAGGTLFQDVPSQVSGALQHSQKAPGYHGSHEIAITPGSLLAEIVGDTRAMVNSFHHQAVAQPPEGFEVIAQTSDGVIEALARGEGSFCLGVQFHPELMAARDSAMAAIFRRFVAAAGG